MKKTSAILLFLLLSVVITLTGCSNENTPIENQTTNDFSQSSINTNEQSVDMENEEPRPTDGIDQLSDNTDEQSPNTEKEEFQPTEQIVEEQIAKDYNFTWIDEETASITIDGVRRTWFPFEYKSPAYDYSADPAWKSEWCSFTFLSDAFSNPAQWTFVQEGDEFLNWKVAEINSQYLLHDDGKMISTYNEFIKFEGEVSICGIIEYWQDINWIYVVPDREYWNLFPYIINMGPSWVPSIALTNDLQGLEKDLPYGKYEADLTIKDLYLYWSGTDVLPYSANFVSIENLSIIEYYDELIP